ncbi:beta-ketoacyl synthase N-terminal-like domain-containing protein [Providencia sp. PROV149]|uniref:beta-ketoacyl synthase N-terminal-like domain-containing protein n=1 Tax=Providencia sp. PROV149 TaxID=2949859 RepID=UPI0023495CB5|nr:beta-ketoacyl synthase N-terminal-like domain-containing protein [Providencia sp. PROV149]
MKYSSNDIAIVSMAGRYPNNIKVPELWELLLNGGTTISDIAIEELEKSEHADVCHDISYVAKCGMLHEKDMFDADLFKMNRLEAMLTDPQQRLFMTCCLEALDLAGLPYPTESGFKTGVFATSTINTYLILNIFKSNEFLSRDKMQILLANEKDFISSRVAYKLNLTGPAITIQSACSSSLVAIHEACGYLRRGEIDFALAGGASLPTVSKTGYLFTPGGAVSSDGQCKVFDEKADGTIFTDGVGVITLCRLSDAIAHGFNIYAVIKGSAINNNGNDSLNIAAPSIHGQSEVIKAAFKAAKVNPDDIDFIEAHGTGTYLGDPIEVKALSTAFATTKRQYCALGSIKSNVGHTDTTSGVTGIIKAALAIKNRILPATINYTKANPQLDIANTPFFICDNNYQFKAEKEILYGGVSSFGFGGTNAHAILASAPKDYLPNELVISKTKCKHKLLLWSDRSESALREYVNKTINSFKRYNDSELNAIAYTLGLCRHEYAYRTYAVTDSIQATHYAPEMTYHRKALEKNKVVFLFPGQGTDFVDVYTTLYEENELFRNNVDTLSQKFEPYLGEDIRKILFPSEDIRDEALEKSIQTKWAQPALFIISTSLSQVLQSYEITPDYLMGHSLGELSAAYIAGAFNEDDAVKCIATRALLMNDTPEGMMLVIFSNHEIFHIFPEEIKNKLDIAAINSPTQFVISGKADDINMAISYLNELEIKSKPLDVKKGFHSKLMNNIIDKWKEYLLQVNFKKMTIPVVSNLTGEILTKNTLTNSEYWIKHLRETVHFSDGINGLTQHILERECAPIFIDLSAKNALTAISLMNNKDIYTVSVSNRGHGVEQKNILNALGEIWSLGVNVNFSDFIPKSYVVELPVANLDSKSYWIVPDNTEIEPQPANSSNNKSKLIKSRDELEELSLMIWRKVIINNDITKQDDFFLLGGDSLQALEITREYKNHSVIVNLSDILSYSNIKDLVEHIYLSKEENEKEQEQDKDIKDVIDADDMSNIFKQLNLD